MSSNFTVRKMSFGEGVERVFPLYSPNVESITVVRRGVVRRAKLYYLRGRTGKRARIAERREVAEEGVRPFAARDNRRGGPQGAALFFHVAFERQRAQLPDRRAAYGGSHDEVSLECALYLLPLPSLPIQPMPTIA